jgi:L-fucose isomerase-like protein
VVQLQPVKLGLIAGNRGFFSDELAAKMRNETIAAMREAGIEVVVPDESMTKLGCVETLKEAYIAGKLFREQAVDGIVVAAVNFGDEQGVAAAIKTADLNVPIYIFGCQEEEVLTPAPHAATRSAGCSLSGRRCVSWVWSTP